MRQRQIAVLSAIGVPLLLIMQFDLSSCIPGAGGPGTGVGGGTVFNLPPTALITTDVTRGIAPLTVQFSSSNSTDDGLIISRRWDFANGQTSPDISPRITFENTGTFVVTLTLTDDAGATSSRTVTIVVTESPVAVIDVDRSAAASAPAIFNFDASDSFDPDGSIVGYRWDFGDGSRELLPTVAHTFATAGTFLVRLTVTDNAGVTASTEQIIDVGIPRPVATFVQPPADTRNIVLTNFSPLWVAAEVNVQRGVPYTLRAGLDGDRDECDAQAVIYDRESGDELFRLEGATDEITGVATSRDGAFVATSSADGSVAVFDAEIGRLINTYPGANGAANAVAFSPDASLMAVGHANGNVVLRRRSNGQIVRTLSGHTDAVNAVAYSADGARIGSASEEGTAIVWNAASGAQISVHTGHTAAVTSIAFSPVNSTQVVTGSVDQSARLWNSSNGQLIGIFQPIFAGTTLVQGHSNAVNAVAFSAFGTQVVTASDDRTAIIWDAGTFAQLFVLRGHSDRVTSAAFAADDLEVVTGSADRSARQWDATTGMLVDSMVPCASTVSAVAFAGDGATFVAGVAAKNAIQLDRIDPPNGGDLFALAPTPLSVRDVPVGQYSLWLEIDTDRTEPQRSYSNATINVMELFTSEISAFTPRVPLLNDAAQIALVPTRARQIFDLGSFADGDQIEIAMMTTPGYRRTFESRNYSVLLLDGSEEMFAWYQNNSVLLDASTRPTFASNTANLYVVVDREAALAVGNDLGIDVRIRRGVGHIARPQRIFLDYRGGETLTAGGVPPINVPPFSAVDVNPMFLPADTATIKNAINQTVADFFAPYDVIVSNSDEGGPPPPPYQAIYFGGRQPFADGLFGIADYIDPRNDTAGGAGLVYTTSIGEFNPGLNPAELGVYIGQVTVHEIGHLVGLRHVDNEADIMNRFAVDPGLPVGFENSPINDDELPNGTIGTQNGPRLLEETIGLN